MKYTFEGENHKNSAPYQAGWKAAMKAAREAALEGQQTNQEICRVDGSNHADGAAVAYGEMVEWVDAQAHAAHDAGKEDRDKN